jgi:uncharacterized membrane protein YkvI
MRLYRYVVPGLVIQAVLVGGGYATGRELVEFFISKGPATGLLGLALTALWISAACVVGFELARQYRAFDYHSFCRIFLGRFWPLFEVGYYALLLLVLSVLSAAAGKLLAQMLGLPELLNSILYMSVVAFVVFFGNSLIEKVISIWSIVFYATYGSMFALVVWKFSPQLHAALAAKPLEWPEAVKDSLSYTGYNVMILRYRTDGRPPGSRPYPPAECAPVKGFEFLGPYVDFRTVLQAIDRRIQQRTMRIFDI